MDEVNVDRPFSSTVLGLADSNGCVGSNTWLRFILHHFDQRSRLYQGQAATGTVSPDNGSSSCIWTEGVQNDIKRSRG